MIYLALQSDSDLLLEDLYQFYEIWSQMLRFEFIMLELSSVELCSVAFVTERHSKMWLIQPYLWERQFTRVRDCALMHCFVYIVLR